jgi:hypothetical protein
MARCACERSCGIDRRMAGRIEDAPTIGTCIALAAEERIKASGGELRCG